MVIETALTEIEHILQRMLGGDYVRFQFETLLKAYALLAGVARSNRPKVAKRNAIFHRLPLPLLCTGAFLPCSPSDLQMIPACPPHFRRWDTIWSMGLHGARTARYVPGNEIKHGLAAS